MRGEEPKRRWKALMLCMALLTTGCVGLRPATLQRADGDSVPEATPRLALRNAAGGSHSHEASPPPAPVDSLESERLHRRWAGRLSGTEVALASPVEMAARTVISDTGEKDDFEQLLVRAGLDTRDEWPVSGSPLTPTQAARVLAALLRKPVTLGSFPPRMAVSHLLREVLESGEVSREELLRRVRRFHRVAVLRPDGYLAWVLTGRTQQKAGPMEWRDGTLHALGFELGRFYISNGFVFREADERFQPIKNSVLVEVYDDADIISRTLDGAEEAFVELALAVGQLLTTDPADSVAALQRLPAGLVALIVNSPAYLERFRHMTRGEQIQVVSKLMTTLFVACGSAAGTTGKVTGALGGAEATVPVLSLSAEGVLVLERIKVPVGALATSVGTGVGGGVYVLSTASGAGGGSGPVGSSSGGGAVEKVLGPRRPTAAQWDRVFENSKDVEGTPRCEYCKKEITRDPKRPESFEVDHRQPYSRGGPTKDENLAPSCRTCNRSKGAQTAEEFQDK